MLKLGKKMKVKIVSGWSNPGGSTLHHIALTNLLNEEGVDCVFHGPHTWHLDKCKASNFNTFKEEEGDIIISHFCNLNAARLSYFGCKNMLSCHETNLWPLKKMDLSQYKTIQYVSESQKNWHDVDHPYVIIPPMVEKVDWTDPENNSAGVIGSVDNHKQTHLSIERALKDGYEKVFLFGECRDIPYYDAHIHKFMGKSNVFLMSHENNRTRMYKKISKVYHSSLRETYGMVEAECRLAGIPFDGPKNNQEVLDREEILDLWKKTLENIG
jgi:hypothetical protein